MRLWPLAALCAALAVPLSPTAAAQVEAGTQSLTVSGGGGLNPTRAALGARYGYFFTPRFEAGPSAGVGYVRARSAASGRTGGAAYAAVGGSARYWLAAPGAGFAPFVGSAADAVFVGNGFRDYAVFEGNAGFRSRLGRGLALTPTAFVQVTEFGDVSQGVRLGACAFF